MNFKLLLKWGAIFGILLLWTAVAITGVPPGAVVPSVAAAEQVTDGTLYMQDGDLLTQLDKQTLLNFLFTHDFTIEHNNDFLPSSTFSLRGQGDMSVIDETEGMGKNSVNINVVDTRNKGSRGSIVLQQKGKRLSVNLQNVEIIQNDLDVLELMGTGKGYYNRQPITADVMIHFDKQTYELAVIGSGDVDFSIDDMQEVTCQHCQNEQKSYNLLIDNGETDTRSIGEVRQLLRDYPMILQQFISLGVLNQAAWITIAPSFVS